MSGTAEQLRQRIQSIVDDGRINGCITGSCMIDAEFDYWETMPDVDVFAYSTNYMIQAVEILINSLGCKWGETDTEISSKQEQTKYKWLLEGKKNNGFDPTLQTVKLHDDNGIVVNVSTRKNCRNVAQVVECFDMSIVMKGIDIRGKYVYDQTKSFSGDPKLAVPNPLKAQIEDVSMWDVKRWVRQFDRVLKYWGIHLPLFAHTRELAIVAYSYQQPTTVGIGEGRNRLGQLARVVNAVLEVLLLMLAFADEVEEISLVVHTDAQLTGNLDGVKQRTIKDSFR